MRRACSMAAGCGRERRVGQQRVVAVVADARGEFGLVLEAPLPVALEQGACAGSAASAGECNERAQQDEGREQSTHRVGFRVMDPIVTNGAPGTRRGRRQPNRSAEAAAADALDPGQVAPALHLG
jgi:hypothetical protein